MSRLEESSYKKVLIGPFNSLEELNAIWLRLKELGWLSLEQKREPLWSRDDFNHHYHKKGRKYN